MTIKCWTQQFDAFITLISDDFSVSTIHGIGIYDVHDSHIGIIV